METVVEGEVGVGAVDGVAGGEVEQVGVVEDGALVVGGAAGVDVSVGTDARVDLPCGVVEEVGGDPGVDLLGFLQVGAIAGALVDHASDFAQAVVGEGFFCGGFGRGFPRGVFGVFFPDAAAVVLGVPAATEGVVEAVFGGVEKSAVGRHLVASDQGQGEPADVVVPAVPAPGGWGVIQPCC